MCAAARAALAVPVDGCIAVTGCDADLVEAALAELGQGRLSVVRAPDWDEGLAASLRAGLAALPPTSRAVVVFLADMPLVQAAAAGPLLDAIERGAVAAEYMAAQGSNVRPAHPVAFSNGLFAELSRLTGDQGGRRLLAGREGVVTLSTTDPGATFDVDRPADLERVCLFRGDPLPGTAHLHG